MIAVYILQSELDQGYYIGITKDICGRLEKHNRGDAISTRKRKPFKLIYSESCSTYIQAREREKQIKSYKGGNSFKKLIGI